MKPKFLLIGGLLTFLHGSPLQAQTKCSKLNLHIEVGTELLYGDAATPERMRNTGFQQYEATSDASGFFIGVKPEFLSNNRRWGVAGGLRLMMLTSSMTPDEKFVYWMMASEGTTTDYIRLTGMKQHSIRLGIPLELRYFLSEKSVRNAARMYVKCGIVSYINVHAYNKVTAYQSSMSQYLPTVEQQLGKMDRFMYSIYPGIGLCFERFFLGPLNLECQIPGLIGSKNPTAFLDSSTRINFSASVEFSLK